MPPTTIYKSINYDIFDKVIAQQQRLLLEQRERKPHVWNKLTFENLGKFQGETLVCDSNQYIHHDLKVAVVEIVLL